MKFLFCVHLLCVCFMMHLNVYTFLIIVLESKAIVFVRTLALCFEQKYEQYLHLLHLHGEQGETIALVVGQIFIFILM